MLALRIFILLLLLVFLTVSPDQKGSILYQEITYRYDGDPRQVLDVYLPRQSRGAAPTLFLILGGSFQTGCKQELSRVARHFATLGYASVVIEYRLLPIHTYLSQIQDAFCALAWLHAHARVYDLNLDFIVAVGESVGGNMAAMLGVVDDPDPFLEGCSYPLSASWVRGVVAFYPVIDLDLEAYGSFFVPYLGVEPSQDPLAWAEASPIHWIDDSEPPFLLIHGMWDLRVPKSVSDRFAAALEGAGVEVEVVSLPQTDHRFIVVEASSEASQQSLLAIEEFLNDLYKREHP